MLIPLAIINHFKPTRELPGMKQTHELYPLAPSTRLHPPRDPRGFVRGGIFSYGDHALKLISKLEFRPMRKRALEEAERWMSNESGRGATDSPRFSAMLNSLMQLRALGYSRAIRFTRRQAEKILPPFR